MASTAGTTPGMGPPCMELIGKLDKRSCFIPSLQKSICSKFDVLFAETQQKMEESLEDLTEQIRTSEEAVEQYTVATKKLVDARDLARSGWWQQIKQIARNAIHKKEWWKIRRH